MTQVYQSLQQTAEDLITQFGQRHQIVRTTGPSGSRTATDYPCEAVQQDVTDRQVAGQTVKNRTATLLVTSSVEPTSRDRIRDPQGSLWEIAAVERIAPGGIVLYYEVTIQR